MKFPTEFPTLWRIKFSKKSCSWGMDLMHTWTFLDCLSFRRTTKRLAWKGKTEKKVKVVSLYIHIYISLKAIFPHLFSKQEGFFVLIIGVLWGGKFSPFYLIEKDSSFNGLSCSLKPLFYTKKKKIPPQPLNK